MNKSNEILKLENVIKKYSDKVSIGPINFSIYDNEFIGIIGESGSGKSTVANLISGTIKKTYGKIFYFGKTIEELTKSEKHKTRQLVQMIFQSPYSSLNPKFNVFELISEGVKYTKIIKNKTLLKKYVSSLMMEVGLDLSLITRYPHELSGGQRQRVSIARALAMQAKIVIADESLSALDMLIQFQIMDLFKKLKEQRQISFIFISHDISMIKNISDRIIVMKDGKIIESGNCKDIFENPKEEYTKELLKYNFHKEVIK